MTTARTPLPRTAYILALFLLLALPAAASAQTPWSTPDASNNINNTNTGNVGVGTSAPAGKLDVKGSTSDASAAALTVRSLSDTNLFFVRNDGRVGIGTTSPLASFHLARGSATTGVAAFFQKDTSSSGITLGTTNSRGFISGVNSDLTAMTDLLVNPFGGNVGIGTTSPGSTLFVATPAGTRSGITIMGDGNSWVYTDLIMRPATTTSISAGMPYSFNWSVRKDNAYGGDASGPSLVMEIARQGGGLYAPFIINPNGNVILAGSLNATNGNVGVGTTTPTVKLDVSGQVRASGGFVFANGTVQTTAATLTGVTAGTGLTGGGSSGSVTLNVAAGTGITAGAGGVSVNYGSTAGTAVQGNTTLTVTAGTGMSGGGTTTLGSGGTVTLNNNDPGSSQFIFKNVGNAAGATQFSAGTNTDTLRFEGTGGTSVSFDTSTRKVVINSTAASSSGWTDGGSTVNLTSLTAKVGIGTTNPTTALEVGRNATGAPTGLTLTGGSTIAAPVLYFNYADAGTNLKRWGVFSDINGGFSIGTQPDAGGVMNQKLFINNAGNVGIGTSTPLSGLSSNGGMELYVPSAIATFRIGTGLAGKNNAQVRFSGASGDNWAIGSDVATHSGSRDFHFYDFAGTPGSRFTIQSATGKVGIGTNTPESKLDIYGGYLHVSGVCGGALPNTQGAYLSWNQTCGTGETSLINHQGQGTGGFAFMNTANGSTLSTLMSISGTGDVTVLGAINAKYQDVAEWVPSTQKLSAGTVVVLDAEKTNHVVASMSAYDTKVAGVVSARPGIALGEGGEDKTLVATTGRVKVKVDATRAPIKVGDLLVTSDTEGVAMRSEPIEIGGRKMHAPGTIIGKALEPLASGTGEILVLLSLQ